MTVTAVVAVAAPVMVVTAAIAPDQETEDEEPAEAEVSQRSGVAQRCSARSPSCLPSTTYATVKLARRRRSGGGGRGKAGVSMRRWRAAKSGSNARSNKGGRGESGGTGKGGSASDCDRLQQTAAMDRSSMGEETHLVDSPRFRFAAG